MKRNIFYIILNSIALGIAVLGISGIAALMVGSVLVLSLVMLKLKKYIPDYLVWGFLFILFGVSLPVYCNSVILKKIFSRFMPEQGIGTEEEKI